jgi:oligoribonuclease
VFLKLRFSKPTGARVAFEKLFWIDLEMTGLDVEREVIIEVGVVITDLDLNPIENYHAIVQQPQTYLDKMDEWNTSHHGASGLTAQVPTGRAPDLVEADLIQLAQKYFPGKDKPVIAGNSISQDRLFIDRYFKKFAGLLHYRMLDVTSWKIMMNAKFGVRYSKQNTHRAVDDILESINEMKLYLSKVKP